MSQPDTLHIIGLSHHTAHVALRERLAFRAEDVPRALGGLLAHGCREAVILSTCNRVEVIAVGHEGGDTGAQIRAFLSEFHGLSESEFVSSLYHLNGCDAARHLFEVAASLDSLILGETEILSQSKEAYRLASAAGAAGFVLRRLFERSFFLSKELRADGGIGRSLASVSSAAVVLARKVFELKGRQVLVVGTGEMATGIVRGLRSAGVTDILVASRTADRAVEFAQREGATPCQMQNIVEHLQTADIVLVSAAAPHFLIGPAHIKKAAAHRHGRDLCLIDISVPRNVDPEVDKMDGTFLFDIDDLEEVARDGRREREAVAEKWRPRLAEEAREILRELQDRGVHDAARKLIENFDAIRLEVLGQARIAGMDPKALAEMTRALERLQGRFLHAPLETLRQAARDGDGPETMSWVWRLFRLEKSSPVLENESEDSLKKPSHGDQPIAPDRSAGPAKVSKNPGAESRPDVLLLGGQPGVSPQAIS